MDAIRYKGYVTLPRHEMSKHAYVGQILGIDKDITYSAEHRDDVPEAFHEAVDRYLADCAAQGTAPAEPCDGHITIDIDPAVHEMLLASAYAADQPLNQYIAEALRMHTLEGLNTWDY